jgi:uncharacterized protein (DUF885 family)
MRWAALMCAATLALMPSSASVREHPELARLTEELTARSGPGFWGETDGPLVRDRLLVVSEPAAREHAAWATGFLKRVVAIAPDELSHEDWITWRLLQWEGEMAAGRGEFFWYDVPITPYASPLRTIGTGFAGAGLASNEERLRYRDGLHQLAVLAGQIEAKLRGQAARGIVLPNAQIDAVVPFIRGFAVTPDNHPMAVAAPRLAAIPEADRDGFAADVRRALADVVVPVFERLASYVDGPYRARAADEGGVGRYPGGDRFYAYLVRLHTGLDLTPDEIHQIGLQEVARLERELDAARQQAGFSGTLAEFRRFLKTDRRFVPSRPEQIAERLRAAAARIEPQLDEWFSERPKAPYGVRRLAPALEPVMTYGYYQVPTAQNPEGYYLYNGSQLDQRSLLNAAALSYHELVPGHHFQMALTLENPRLGRFRKNAMYTAYAEGWAEYASDLAGDMGMYDDPYDRAGRLSMDLFLSTRLVVDTGMNALGWTRERAMAFMREHTFESAEQIATETLRYSTDLPGQALAYKLGSRGIRELRERTRSRLGNAFDVRAFHRAVLGHGSMPIGVLEGHIERAMAAPGR